MVQKDKDGKEGEDKQAVNQQDDFNGLSKKGIFPSAGNHGPILLCSDAQPFFFVQHEKIGCYLYNKRMKWEKQETNRNA